MTTGERIVIVGGGIGGLAAALTLARAGRSVTIFERDELVPTATVEEAFATERPGAPQAHHTHAFLARTVVTLRQRFPDVLDRILAAGSTTLPAARNLGAPQPGDEDLVFLVVRRTTYEWALRQAVLAEPTAAIRAGAGVVGLTFDTTTASTGERPVVTGVRLADGTTIAADAVVVATGRRSALPDWLAEGGVDIAEREHQTKLMYLTRWYRRPPGDQPLPESRGMDAGFVKYLAVPGDNDSLSITLAIRPDDDELRRALLDPARFDEACRRLPGPDRFFAELDLDPLGPVRPMGGLINRLRTFTADDGEPLVLGVHALGDAHTCTNPIYGRGCSLALVQATLLGDAFAAFPDDPVARSREFEAASAREIEPWFHASIEMDKLTRLPSDLDARPSDGPPSPVAALFVAAETEPVLGRGLAKLFNLLVTPAELAAEAEFTARSMEVVANPGAWPVPAHPGPTRRELLALLHHDPPGDVPSGDRSTHGGAPGTADPTHEGAA